MTYGEMIRNRRTAIGMRQSDLAEHLGCSDSYIAHIESEKRQPSAGFIDAIAAELGLSDVDRESLLLAVEQARSNALERRQITRSLAGRTADMPDAKVILAALPAKGLDLDWECLIANMQEAYANPALRDHAIRMAQSLGDMARGQHSRIKGGKRE